MLNDYMCEDNAELKRRSIVAAALQVAIAAAGAASANDQSARADYVLDGVTKEIGKLADAIEEALKKIN